MRVEALPAYPDATTSVVALQHRHTALTADARLVVDGDWSLTRPCYFRSGTMEPQDSVSLRWVADSVADALRTCDTTDSVRKVPVGGNGERVRPYDHRNLKDGSPRHQGSVVRGVPADLPFPPSLSTVFPADIPEMLCVDLSERHDRVPPFCPNAKHTVEQAQRKAYSTQRKAYFATVSPVRWRPLPFGGVLGGARYEGDAKFRVSHPLRKAYVAIFLTDVFSTPAFSTDAEVAEVADRRIRMELPTICEVASSSGDLATPGKVATPFPCVRCGAEVGPDALLCAACFASTRTGRRLAPRCPSCGGGLIGGKCGWC